MSLFPLSEHDAMTTAPGNRVHLPPTCTRLPGAWFSPEGELSKPPQIKGKKYELIPRLHVGATCSHSNMVHLAGVKMDRFEQSIATIEADIQSLHDEAMRAADAYWDFVNDQEKKMAGTDRRSELELSCTRRGNNIQIMWKQVRWFGPANKRVRKRMTIASDKDNFHYKDAVLKDIAKEWEWELVKETELIMQSIRRQNNHLVRAIMSIRNARAVRRVADEKLDKLQAQAS